MRKRRKRARSDRTRARVRVCVRNRCCLFCILIYSSPVRYHTPHTSIIPQARQHARMPFLPNRNLQPHPIALNVRGEHARWHNTRFDAGVFVCVQGG